MGRVQDKIAIITGAASELGMGFAIARAPARGGAVTQEHWIAVFYVKNCT
jgi:NADP-dependent 3-hydroxy acid dehydrogenase YdfG